MKVTINYTTKAVTIDELASVFQNSHNIDTIQVALDHYDSSQIYKMNFVDASGVSNLSRQMTYIGTTNGLYYFRIKLNSTNTKYSGNISLSMSIYDVTIDGEVTTYTKVWTSEQFEQYVNESIGDETIDIDGEEATLIDEIYAAIALKLNTTQKANYSTTDLGLTGSMTTNEYILAVNTALLDGVVFLPGNSPIIVYNDDNVTISDAPTNKVYLYFSNTYERNGLLFTSDYELNKLYYFMHDDSDYTGWVELAKNGDLSDHIANISNPHGVTKAQVGLGNCDNTSDANKPVSAAQLAALTHKENISNKNIEVRASGVATDVKYPTEKAVRDVIESAKVYADSAVSTHDNSHTAHEYIRTLIEQIALDIARLDGRGVSYGEVPYLTSELEALDTTTRDATILAAIQAMDWGDSYSPATGDLVYDQGTGDGVSYHEWEFSGTHWVDNGAINSPFATNTIFGSIKGDSTYLSIVAGVVQVLLADNATYLKDASSTDKYTYQQIKDALDARYTISEVDALLESLKLIQGVEETALGTLYNTDTILLSTLQEYDYIVAEVRRGMDNNARIFNASDMFSSSSDYMVITTTNGIAKLSYTGIYPVYVKYEDAYGIGTPSCILKGIKFIDGTVHDEMRSVGEETITYRDDGKVSQVVADTVTTTPTYDEYGNITKITEVYALDGKTYETTFTYDKFGRISATNKGEV